MTLYLDQNSSCTHYSHLHIDVWCDISSLVTYLNPSAIPIQLLFSSDMLSMLDLVLIMQDQANIF